MAPFNQRPGTKSAGRFLKRPFADVTTFSGIIKSLVLKNPLGCTPYRSAKKAHPPVE